MQRRKFLDNLLSLLIGFSLVPQKMLALQPGYGKSLTIKISGQEKRIAFIEKYGRVYFSLVDFAQKANYGFFTNQEKRKTVLYIAGDTIKFTADNGFVVLNEQLLQILYEPFWKEGEVWVPAEALADLMNTYTSQAMQFDRARLIFTIGKKNVNIRQVQVSEKENGTLIRILTTASFKKDDIALKLVNGWLYAAIYKGKVDPNALASKRSAGLIRRIQAIQFKQSVSIAFRLRGKIKSKELQIDPDSGDILISLRTVTAAENNRHTQNDLEAQKKEWMIHTIVIDPGHGGKDPGAIGYRGIREKDIVLPVALKLGKELHKRLSGVKIIFTRKSDVFIPLWKRTKIANEKNGKLFVSLHCNSNPNKKVRGFETYFLSAEKDAKARNVVLKENASVRFESQTDKKRYEGVNFVLATLAQNAFIKYSQYLASVVQKALSKKMRSLDMISRGVKQGPFWVMVGATMPNILVEMGFISNKHEALLLKQKSTQTRIAAALSDGIVKYKKDIESAL